MGHSSTGVTGTLVGNSTAASHASGGVVAGFALVARAQSPCR